MTEKAAKTDDYLSLFLNDTPLMDVRSPVEHSKGSFPFATNYHLLDDQQRAQIGTYYKQQGHNAAVKLGYELATDKVREHRMAGWITFITQNPQCYLFCFRGGERSHITQAWLKDSGYDIPLINGGYKAMRSFLLEQLEESISDRKIIVLSGKTGTGKTRLLNKLQGSIDLEGIANHRGSTFGRRVGGQPSQIDFENRLSIALLKHRHQHPSHPVILEDESKLIGRCSLPQSLRDKMQASPIILLEESVDRRVDIGIQEYITDNLKDLTRTLDPDEALNQLFDELQSSLSRIQRRLGGLRFQQLNDILSNAIKRHKTNNDLNGYRPLISSLLSNYYDPMYDYQLTQKQDEILYRGNNETILEKFNELAARFC